MGKSHFESGKYNNRNSFQYEPVIITSVNSTLNQVTRLFFVKACISWLFMFIRFYV